METYERREAAECVHGCGHRIEWTGTGWVHVDDEMAAEWGPCVMNGAPASPIRVVLLAEDLRAMGRYRVLRNGRVLMVGTFVDGFRSGSSNIGWVLVFMDVQRPSGAQAERQVIASLHGPLGSKQETVFEWV